LNRLLIKICGVTTAGDAVAAVDAGADAIGLNFYPASSRVISADRAAEISAAVGARAWKVGVFVNRPAIEIRELVERCRLDAVQLHGDEPPIELAALAGITVIRAFRVAASLAPAEEYLQACDAIGALPSMTLVDAAAPGVYGGSGRQVDWGVVAGRGGLLARLPLVLAGGLTAQNVAQAIVMARPTGVDVASGVEESPGKKSRSRMMAFVTAARRAVSGATLG